MRRVPMQVLPAGLLLLIACLPCLAAAGPWQKVKPGGPKRALPKGKTLVRSVSPDRRSVLLVRDEGERGDFFWRSVYVQHGRAFTLLTKCNQLRDARWSRKPAAVRFEADTAVGPSEMERREWVYTPSTRVLRKRTLRKLRVEGTG